MGSPAHDVVDEVAVEVVEVSCAKAVSLVEWRVFIAGVKDGEFDDLA